MSIVLVATFLPDPESRAELVHAFEDVIAAVQAEPGCELYALHENDDCLVMIEKWADSEALAAHRTSDAMARLRPALAGQKFELRELTPHPIGSAQQGAL